jgi:hypothetical protein
MALHEGQQTGRAWKLLSVTGRARYLLLITRHYMVFDVHGGEAAATRSFA